MWDDNLSKEEQILKMMKKVLTDVAKDTHVKPGLKHPLSDNTILGIRDCLSLITARETELAKAAGRESNMKPRFADQPKDSVVVPISNLKRKNKESDESSD
jgi:hypothetical protein